MVKLIPSRFTKKGLVGDFSYMINRKKYEKTLFIYNDNTEAFTSRSRKAGRGNAVIRPFRFTNPVRACPIPTGSFQDRGFKTLTPEAKAHIDNSIEEIRFVIEKYDYKELCYSADEDGLIGMSLFQFGKDVQLYITEQLRFI